MNRSDLLDFLNNRMSMTDLYQPVIIRELLLHEGIRTKSELAAILASYDTSVQEYYEKIVMRWPKITLTKHGIVDYERKGSVFRLSVCPDNPAEKQEAVQLCEEKIAAWLNKKSSADTTVKANASIRYAVLKEARGKCQLCGIPAEVRPIDIDHIVPRAKADKNGKVRLNGRLVPLDDPQNLQACASPAIARKGRAIRRTSGAGISWCVIASPKSSKLRAVSPRSRCCTITPCAAPSTTNSAKNMQRYSMPRTQTRSARSWRI